MQSKAQQDLLDRFISGDLLILVEDAQTETELAWLLFSSEKDGGLGFEENCAISRSVVTDRGVSYFVKIWTDKKSVGVVFKAAAFVPKDENVIKAADFIKCIEA
jgi:hypothetical protein